MEVPPPDPSCSLETIHVGSVSRSWKLKTLQYKNASRMKRDPLAASEKKPKKLYPLDHSSRLCSSRKILPRSVKPWGVLIISFFCSQLCEIFFIFSSSFPESKEQINVCLARCAVRQIFFQVAKGHFYNMLKTNLDNDCTSSSFVFWLFFARVKTLSNSESWRFSLGTNIFQHKILS